MPASRNTPPLPGPAGDLLEALWDRVAALGERAADPGEFERVASQVSAVAREAGLLPEHLVVGVRNSWSTSRSLRVRPDRPVLEWVLTDFVARTIRAYFAVPSDPRMANAAPALPDPHGARESEPIAE